MTRTHTSRRGVLRLSGLVGCGCVAGCSALQSEGGTGDSVSSPDDKDDETDDTASTTPLSWIPDPEAVTTATRPPVLTARPAAFHAVADRLAESIPAFVDHPVTRHAFLDLDPAAIDGVASGPATTAITGYDREGARAGLLDAGFERTDGDGEVALYERGDGDVTVALGTGVLLVGRRTQAATAREVVAAARRAGRGEDRYAAATGLGGVASPLSDAPYRLLVPVDSGETAPDRGLFATERGYGVALTPDGDRTDYTAVRAFDGDAPQGALDRWFDQWEPSSAVSDVSLSTESGRATVAGTATTSNLLLYDLARTVRSAAATEPGVDRRNGRVHTINVTAMQFTYQPFIGDDLTVPVGEPVTFTLTSRDVVHGFRIEGTPVERTVLAGEETSVTVTFEDSGQRTVSCSRYCGTGHDVMEAQFRVGD